MMKSYESKRSSANVNKLHRKMNSKKWIPKLMDLSIIRKTNGNEFSKFNLFKQVKYMINLNNIVHVMYRPTDAASLGVVRALFGLCMVLDVVEERGFADVDVKWGDPHKCHFPLIHGMKPPSLPWMIVLFSVMWTGAFGIMLGFYFKLACAFFVFPYWYLFLLDKSYWNNHTYLFGIVAILLWSTDANKYFSIDAMVMKEKNQTVPFWNYLILKFQFFALYFLAGLKKGCKEWLDGYAMTNLSNHWVFDPFRVLLTTKQTDLFIVHWFGFFFDLTIGFWMLFERTRFPAMFFFVAFHFMNSRLFSIGMFPYVCLATMFLFCDVDWPRRFQHWLSSNIFHLFKCKQNKSECIPKDLSQKERNVSSKLMEPCLKKKESENNDGEAKNTKRMKRIVVCQPKVKKSQILVVTALFCHVILQILLPYSHFITKGYNNWVPGLYGYSWDMMIHAWDTILVVVKVHDNENNVDHFIDPEAWIQNDRWYKHGDMLKQYAHCLKENLIREKDLIKNNAKLKKNTRLSNLSSNISVYTDVWCSLNGRFQQRMFNPNVDLLKANWNLFQPISYLMPLMSDLSYYRKKLEEIQRSVYTWSNYTDVLFIADFPNMILENYIHDHLDNVSLTVLEGSITYIEEGRNKKQILTKDCSTRVKTETFHQIHVTSSYPACYMYTYRNSTKQHYSSGKLKESKIKDSVPVMKEIKYKINAWMRALSRIIDAYFYFFYNIPIVRRVKIK